MVLNDITIRVMIEHDLLIDFRKSEDCTKESLMEQVNPNSLDLTIGKIVRYPFKGGSAVYGQENTGRFPLRRRVSCVVLEPGAYCLAAAREYIKLPRNICGQVFLKSSLGRMFVNHMLAGVVDAGYEGRLTLEFKNDSNDTVYIPVGSRVVQLVLMRMISNAEQDYGERKTSRYFGATEPEESKGARA